MEKLKELVKALNSIDISYINGEYNVHAHENSGKCNRVTGVILENIIDHLHDLYVHEYNKAEAHAPMNAECEKCGRRYCDHENKY